jgi:hypothetical protein
VRFTASTSDPSARYALGTLSYTKMGLVSLFAWLLWGDFCFQVMESLNPAIIPLKLRALDAPNWVIALIMVTLPGILIMSISPWVSFKIDSHCTPLGRRIPFILYTLPFLTASPLRLGFSEQIGHGER